MVVRIRRRIGLGSVEMSSVGQQEGEEVMQKEEGDAEQGVHGAQEAAAWRRHRGESVVRR